MATAKTSAAKPRATKSRTARKAAPTAGAGDRELLRMRPGNHPVVTCYLKIEARDRARNKYLTKVKNRVKELQYALPSLRWTREQQEAIKADCKRIMEWLSDSSNLPTSNGVAIFASKGQSLFEVRPLPKVHRSRLVVDRTPLVRELAASEEEFGRIFTETDVMRGGRFHGPSRWDLTGEHAYHNRIQNEKKRHLEAVARTLFELDRASPGHQVVVAGAGNDAAALEPFLHNYVADRLIGLAKLAPKDASPANVHQLTMDVRAAHTRASENRHVAELKEGLGTGWAVTGVRETLKALGQGQVRTLLVNDGETLPGFRSMATGRLAVGAVDLRGDGDVVPTLDVIDDAIEEALRQRVALDVVHDEGRADIDGLAALLRFK
jgi:peptide chain release factor subunit 1